MGRIGLGEKGYQRAQFERKGGQLVHVLLFLTIIPLLQATPKPLPSPPRSVPLPFQKAHLTLLGPHSLTTSPILVCRCFVSAARCLNSLGKGELPKEMDSAVLILSSSFHCLPQP